MKLTREKQKDSDHSECKLPVNQPVWKILIVDDELDIHAITHLSLRNFNFADKGLQLLQATSAHEAKAILSQNTDIALALIDVVMETEDAGLKLVEYIRNDLKNKLIRLIIRTGQPGIAPERIVVDQYDINDYKDKTELTAQKLYTTIRSALKSFQELSIIDAHRHHLEEIFAVLTVKNQEIHKLNEELEGRVEQRTTELHAQVEELIHTRNELIQSEKMASLGRLVAGFAHEINTPIGVAVGATSTLLETSKNLVNLMTQEEVSEEEMASELESLQEAAELTSANLRRASRLVSSFKRTAVDQSSEAQRLFNVKETIEDVSNSLHNKFKKTAIKIHIDCPDTLIVYSVPGILDQVLTNLMMNSLLHGFEEGTLAGEIFISAQLQTHNLHIKYADTGEGMSQKAVEKVFEPFFTTRRGQGGSGLGMYICYNLITGQLHGTINCESSPSNGVTFFIDYPVQTDEPTISEH